MDSHPRRKICFVVAVPVTARNFLKRQIARLSQDYDIYLIADIKNLDEIANLNIAGFRSVEIRRSVSPWHDIMALAKIWVYMIRMRFDCVHSLTPKAGLLCAIAAWCALIKHRVHTFTGQVWATRSGLRRRLLMNIDRLIAVLDTKVLADSHSQLQYLRNCGILPPSKGEVLCNGSICGVDTEIFKPDSHIRASMRQMLNVTANHIVFAYLGRMHADKGIFDLLRAFDMLLAMRDDVYLLLVGRDECNIKSGMHSFDNIVWGKNAQYIGVADNPAEVLQAADVFVMPSHREGFGMSVIEASASGLPTITSDIYGLKDSSVAGVTGIMYECGNSLSLCNAMNALVSNPERRLSMGIAGRKRTSELYMCSKVTEAWYEFYKNLIPSI